AAFLLGILGGRRLRFGSVSLDLLTGPAFALLGTNTSVEESPTLGRRVTRTDGGAQPRWALGTRLNFRARPTVRAFVGIDAEVPLTDEEEITAFDAIRLPSWSMGLSLGGTVGTL